MKQCTLKNPSADVSESVDALPRKSRKSLKTDERGVAYAEFLIAFPPVLILLLCLVQLSLMSVGKLAVRHSANRAARAAVAVLPNDLQYYDDEEVNEIDYHDSGSATESESFFGAGVAPGGGSRRLRAIRSAEYIPLTPLTPFTPLIETVIEDECVRSAFDRGVLDALAGAFGYSRSVTSVSFPEPELLHASGRHRGPNQEDPKRRQHGRTGVAVPDLRDGAGRYALRAQSGTRRARHVGQRGANAMDGST